jgi:uncharacterized protein YjdB
VSYAKNYYYRIVIFAINRGFASVLKRTKRIAPLILILALLFSFLPAVSSLASAVASNWTDEGNYNTVTVGNVTISSARDFAGFAVNVKAGSSYEGYTVTLGADIDLSGYNWIPIGYFTGTFDGGNYTITNLSINTVNSQHSGLFSYTENATLKNVTISGNINASDYSYLDVGGLIGTAVSTNISNCSSFVNVTAACTSVTASSGYLKAGSLIGWAKSDGPGFSITDCSGTGNVTVSANSANLSITCGGLAGDVWGYYNYQKNIMRKVQISGCSYSDGTVTYSSSPQNWYLQMGGLFGSVLYSDISNCSSNAVINSEANFFNAQIGGFSGYCCDSEICNTYSNSQISISGTDATAGGFIGYYDGESITAGISNCYATGSLVCGTTSYKGGFIGWNRKNIIKNCFWQSGLGGNTSHTTGGIGLVLSGTVNSLAMLTSDQLKGSGKIGNSATLGTQSYPDNTVVEALSAYASYYNYSCIWRIGSGINGGYPYLIPGVSLSSFVSDMASPQMKGTSITFTCNAAGGTSLLYRFSIYTNASGWNVVQGYSQNNTYIWTTSIAGTYSIRVEVKDSASIRDYDKYAQISTFKIAAPLYGETAYFYIPNTNSYSSSYADDGITRLKTYRAFVNGAVCSSFDVLYSLSVSSKTLYKINDYHTDCKAVKQIEQIANLKTDSTDTAMIASIGTHPVSGTNIYLSSGKKYTFSSSTVHIDVTASNGFEIISFNPLEALGQRAYVNVDPDTSEVLEVFYCGDAPRPSVTSLSSVSGTAAGGTSVVITGTGFLDATASVKFGSVNATSFRVDSATQITAVSPAGIAGTVHIRVTTWGGTSTESANDQFTYLTPVAVTSLTLSAAKLSVNVGMTTQLTATILPENATDKSVTWTSSNTAVATVDSSGMVTGVAMGKATITALSPNGKKATCSVTVNQPASSVSLSQDTASIDAGKSVSLKATVGPDEATVKKVTWSSSDIAVATVSSSGSVKGVGRGTAVITVTTVDGGFTDTCTVTVKQPVTSVTLSQKTLIVNSGATAQLTATINPASADDQSVTWTSSNPAAATVDSSGKVTGIATGKATITALSPNGKKATCSVTVNQPAQSVSLNLNTASIDAGKSVSLKATVNPSGAGNKKVTWTSSNPAVATVSTSGSVKGISRGTAVITVTTLDGGFTATCTVTVRQPVTSIVMSQRTMALTIGASGQLTATVNPISADDRAVTWTSSNTAIVTVDSSGKVTAIAKGTATITASTSNGKRATCKVTVS